MAKKLAVVFGGISALGFSTPVLALASLSVGEAGIDALRLHKFPYQLTGRKIAIGQVEIGRPGRYGLDKAVSGNRAIALTGVFLRDRPAKANANLDPHAENVASVMISSDKAIKGVAPGARLYSAAVGSLKTSGQQEECLSAQHVAMQNSGDVRAINFSFGETLERDPRLNARLDGNALLTQCIDWSSRFHNVLYAIAGNQGKGGIPIPTDNFNAINVAFSSRRAEIFDKVDVSNISDTKVGAAGRLNGKEVNLGIRRAISLLAPGSNIPSIAPSGKVTKVSGTSFAAPHVTATVALLQEYSDKKLQTKQPHWALNARRQEVMKAILLNSADKIQDRGDLMHLGMTKTIIDKQNQNWTSSDAYSDPKIPLHAQMGTGQLNAFRAYQQFSAAQWQPTAVVPAIGWDYRTLKANFAQDYVLAQPLPQGSFVAITLVWNRLVELNDKNKNQQYDLGESFRDRGLNNLDLYLVNTTSNRAASSICTSVSEVDSVEHIFCPVPVTGNYKIRVQFRKQVNAVIQDYALAWWTKGNAKPL